MVDGSFFTRFRYGRAVRSSEDVWGKITVDLGAVYWVDWVRTNDRSLLRTVL